MSEQTPFWKKEISLSRKPAAKRPVRESGPVEGVGENREVPPADADGTDPGEVVRTPWWKKEIGGSKKPKVEVAAAAEPKKTPWYKKEIGGSKEPKVETAAAAAEPKKTPWYKKEMGGSKEPKVETAAAVPWWKREVTIGRKRASRHEKTVEQLVEAAVQTVAPPAQAEGIPAPAPIEPETLPVAPEPAPVAPTPVAPAPVAETPAPPEPAPVAPAPVAEAPAPPAPTPVAPAPAPAPAVETVYVAPPPAPEPVAEYPTGLEPLPEPPPLPAEAAAVLAGTQPVPEPIPAPAPAPAPAPVAPEPVAPAPAVPAAPVEVTAVQPAPESWEAPPQVPGPEPVVVHPPVPADELPPLPAEPKAAAAKPVPFWKREVTIGKPRAPKQPKQPKERKAAKAEKATPFWKREVTLGKPKAAKDTPKPPKQPKAPKQPFWKAQLQLPSLGGGGGGGRRRSSGKGAKRLVGLKVGGSQIAAARVNNNGTAELVQIARRPLAPGVVVSGELRDPDTLAEELREFFRVNKLPKRNVRLGIASNRIGVRTFEVDGVQDDRQLTNAIQFRAQETLPIPIEEAVLDYQVLAETVDDEGQPTRKILLVVAYRELVDRYVSACRKAGISLVGIDLEAFALLRALGAPRPTDEPASAALVAVTIGHDRSTFAVSDGRVCEFTRVLEWGGGSLNVAIARALDLAPSEVEGVKRALSLDGGPAPAGLTAEQATAALDATRKQLQAFARELVSSLQFYQNQPGSLGIGEIVVTGGTAHLPGLAAELQRLIGVHVRVGDPLARMKVSKRVGEDEQLGSYAVAIGLGIED